MLTGELTLAWEDQQHTFVPGEIFVMAAGCEHTEWFGPEGATYLVGRKHRAADLIAIDWGTTGFRAYRLRGDGAVAESRSATKGILAVRTRPVCPRSSKRKLAIGSPRATPRS